MPIFCFKLLVFKLTGDRVHLLNLVGCRVEAVEPIEVGNVWVTLAIPDFNLVATLVTGLVNHVLGSTVILYAAGLDELVNDPFVLLVATVGLRSVTSFCCGTGRIGLAIAFGGCNLAST